MIAYLCPECGGSMRGLVCQACGADWFEDHSEGPDFDPDLPDEIIRALPHPTELPGEPRQLDAIDAIGRMRRSDTTAAGAPVLHLPWWRWPLAPVVTWEVIVMPEPSERWRIWIVGDPEQILFFCTQRGWPYAAHRRAAIDQSLPAFEDANA